MSTFTSGQWQQMAFDIIMFGKLSSEEVEAMVKTLWGDMDSPFFRRVLQDLEAEVTKNEV